MMLLVMPITEKDCQSELEEIMSVQHGENRRMHLNQYTVRVQKYRHHQSHTVGTWRYCHSLLSLSVTASVIYVYKLSCGG